jgi:hypothetical protein
MIARRRVLLLLILVVALIHGCGKSPTKPKAPSPPPPLPDLIPVAVPGGFNAPLQCGYSRVIIQSGSIWINNQGSAAAIPPVRVVLGLAPASDTSGNSYVTVFTWTDWTNGVRWGPDSLWYNGQFSFDLPPCYQLGPGYYRWIVRVDPESLIVESDKWNNKLASTAQFQVTY